MPLGEARAPSPHPSPKSLKVFGAVIGSRFALIAGEGARAPSFTGSLQIEPHQSRRTQLTRTAAQRSTGQEDYSQHNVNYVIYRPECEHLTTNVE